MDKRALVEQLVARIQETANVAKRAAHDATIEAREGATPAEKRDDARVALEAQSLAKGQSRRAERANAALSALEAFRPRPLPSGARIALGAVVEVEDGAAGRRTRTRSCATRLRRRRPISRALSRRSWWLTATASMQSTSSCPCVCEP